MLGAGRDHTCSWSDPSMPDLIREEMSRRYVERARASSGAGVSHSRKFDGGKVVDTERIGEASSCDEFKPESPWLASSVIRGPKANNVTHEMTFCMNKSVYSLFFSSELFEKIELHGASGTKLAEIRADGRVKVISETDKKRIEDAISYSVHKLLGIPNSKCAKLHADRGLTWYWGADEQEI